jgi:hypothetical protein
LINTLNTEGSQKWTKNLEKLMLGSMQKPLEKDSYVNPGYGIGCCLLQKNSGRSN